MGGCSRQPLVVRFLNVERTLPEPIDWRLEGWPEAPQLWRFHLHYHEFLLDLVAGAGKTETDPCFARAWNIVGQWIENNPLSDPRVYSDAWHPYCISRRLPVWICLWTTRPPDEPLRKQVLDSLWMQARYLAGHLERDLGGNHLLENLRALILAGCFLDCPEAEGWRHLAGRFLRDELAEQILPHGEHFERSPMYHAAMLDAVLDIRDATGELMPQTAALAAETAEKMGGFLREVLHPDGGIPLLGDSCFGETPSPAGLIERTGDAKSEPRSLPPTRAKRCGDYWIYRDEESFVLLDAGPVGPDHLPAHAHADLLTFEASFGGSRLFVDSGVGSYQDDDDRRYCRSTAAHNALEIDGTDQCDMWSKFRMGYRGWPSGLTVGETAGFFWAGATHNAYRRLGVPNVGRWFACRPGGPWICVDWAVGKGWHRYTNRLHLYPEVAAEQTGDSEVALKLEERTLKLRFFAPGEVAIEQGWYYPEMGCRQSAAVVCWRASTRRPVVCGWALTGDDAAGNADLDARDIRDLRVRWTDPDGATELRLPVVGDRP